MRLDILSVWNRAAFYRERNGWAENEHSARVKYDEHQELDISERLSEQEITSRRSMNCLG